MEVANEDMENQERTAEKVDDDILDALEALKAIVFIAHAPLRRKSPLLLAIPYRCSRPR
jgi:hypothetical protein